MKEEEGAQTEPEQKLPVEIVWHVTYLEALSYIKTPCGATGVCGASHGRLTIAQQEVHGSWRSWRPQG